MDRRLYHLDFLRAFALFVGVFYRSAYADAGAGNYDFVRDASGAFRMACFFIISGYFSVALLERRDHYAFLKSRVIMLLVPALVCVLILAPFTRDWMDAYYSEVGASKEFRMYWMFHAWFLFALIAFTVPISLIVSLSRGSVGWLSRHLSLSAARGVLFWGIVFICVFLNTILLPSFMWDLPHGYLIGVFLMLAIKHFPFFLLGVLMFLWRDLYIKWNSGYQIWFVAAAASIGGALLLAYVGDQYTAEGIGLQALEFFTKVYEYFLAIMISIALMSFSARYLDKDIWVVRIMTQSAYTVYVVHFMLVSLFLLVLHRVGLPMDARMILAAFATCVGGMLFHFAVVKRFKLTSLLFNGKLNYGSGAAGGRVAGNSMKV